MNHTDHVALLQHGVRAGGIWADFGSGTGSFTLALSELTGARASVYSIDKDEVALTLQKKLMRHAFPSRKVIYLHADFTQELPLPRLDGIIMANSLHFVKKQIDFMKRLPHYLKHTGRLILVEYNSEHGNQWVPYPISFRKLAHFTKLSGWHMPQMLATHPSNFLNEIYAAMTQPKVDYD